MAIDRYSKDYRLIDSVDGRGRIHSETEYIGAYYVFDAGLDTARGAGKRLALLCALSWLGFLAALYPPSTAGRTLYAALPCAFLALPLWLLSTVGFTALRAGEPLIHRDADRFTLRLPSAAVFAAVLSAGAFLGGVTAVLLAGHGMLPGDWLFLGGMLLVFACTLLCRRLVRPLAVRTKT